MPDQGEMFDKPRKHTKLPGEGYAASPGSGPRGETCRSCRHLRRLDGRKATWNKCRLVKWSSTKNTDIRLDAPACLRWEGRPTDNDKDSHGR